LNRQIFTKLLGLFLLLQGIFAVVMELLFHRLISRAIGELPHGLSRGALWCGLIAFCVALPIAAWAAASISARLERILTFARRLAEGELSARIENPTSDELSSLDLALNQTAERLSHNFSELESRRQELATILDAMQEAVVAITGDGLVHWSNSVMQRITGAQIRTGRPLIHSVRDPELLRCMKEAIETSALSVGRATSLTPGRVLEINAAPLPSGGALAVLHDVTSVEAAERSRRDFIANVSHELRTPLTSIQGYVETILDDPSLDLPMRDEFLNIILKNATRMCRITEDLLALASIESPAYELNARMVSARQLIQEILDALGGMIVDSEVEVIFDGAPDLPILVDFDSMNQVLGNLIENAIKYAGVGKKIVVAASEQNGEIEFTVKDFGPGISSEHQLRIFERFYRVDKARSRDAGGTGLGLAIVKHIVMAHGGRIWVTSMLGQGSTFHFTVPIAANQDE